MQQNGSLFSSKVGDCSQMRQDVLKSVATLYDLHLFFDFFTTGALGANNSSRLLKVFKFLHSKRQGI